MYSVQNWTLLSNNLYIFGRNTFNIDLNYILKQFLEIFEHSVKSLNVTLWGGVEGLAFRLTFLGIWRWNDEDRSKIFIISTEFHKNISDWSYDCTDCKNGIDFFMRLVKWPKIDVKKCQNLIFKVDFQCQKSSEFF